jgi:hypothetical protein
MLLPCRSPVTLPTMGFRKPLPATVTKDTPAMSSEKLAKLKQQQEQIARKIRLEKQRISSQDRKDDTRRKIIAGALALNHREKNPTSDFARKLDALLDEYVFKPHERALFGLPIQEGNDNAAGDTASGISEEYGQRASANET